ncbi:MAG: hypothetical protein RL559_1567 [Pseudomonadota bacterium]|jgi:cytochrome b
MHTPSSATTPVPQRQVVDAWTRTLHALIALSFGLAYISSELEGWRWVHATLGYTLAGALLVRVLWGLWGPRRVRLQALGARLGDLAHLHEMVQDWAWVRMLKLIVSVSVVAVLVVAAPVLASGYVRYLGWLGPWTEEVHEVLANTMLFAVLGHIGAVAVLTLFKQGQLRPMWRGRVEGPGPDLVKHNLVGLAVVSVLLVACFWAWQTHAYVQDPQFTQPTPWLHPVGGYDEERDD